MTTLITGTTQAELGQGTERTAAGDVCLGSFAQDYLVKCHEFRSGIITVPAVALAQAAGSLPGQPGPDLRFESLRPVSPSAAALWQQTAEAYGVQPSRTLRQD